MFVLTSERTLKDHVVIVRVWKIMETIKTPSIAPLVGQRDSVAAGFPRGKETRISHQLEKSRLLRLAELGDVKRLSSVTVHLKLTPASLRVVLCRRPQA